MSVEIVMYRGDDQDFRFTITQGATPLDLTGATISFTARAALDDVTPTISLTSGAGDIVPDADQTTNPGDLVLSIPSSATADIDPNTTLVCDFEVTLGGKVHTWPEPSYGDSTLIRLRIRGDVTHA